MSLSPELVTRLSLVRHANWGLIWTLLYYHFGSYACTIIYDSLLYGRCQRRGHGKVAA